MKSYSEVRKEVADKLKSEPATRIRTNYQCAARGCPNTSSIDDGGPEHPGRCYWHWREPDPNKWPLITQGIQDDFKKMRNFGEI